jgi:hypothetical protein
LLKYLSFMEKKISQKLKMAPLFNMEIFFGFFSRSFHVRQKCLHILKEQTPKQIKNIVAKKLNSKWPLNSRWVPKPNFLMLQKRISFALGLLANSNMHFRLKKNKKKFGSSKMKFLKIQDGAYIQHVNFFAIFF